MKGVPSREEGHLVQPMKKMKVSLIKDNATDRVKLMTINLAEFHLHRSPFEFTTFTRKTIHTALLTAHVADLCGPHQLGRPKNEASS
mmetsp:Transcript_14214/g.21598  ORF Transcript_14214/g.21598 Transcript_14214/m.21598 type:complete len:87 (-) Transcript_14214:114-374(-)